MFKTKSQVDRHVSNVLKQLKDPNERNVKGLAFASLYYKINEYDVAFRYLQGFLAVKETYASAHKLLGQIYEARKQPSRALDAYKRSLELDENQKDVLRKVCKMCVQVDVPPDIYEYWVERANKTIRGDPIVLALKGKLCSCGRDKSEGDADDLEEFLAQQLVKQPRDTSLRCRQVRHLLERGRVGEARKHVLEIEQTGVFVENLEWGRVVRQVLEECIERAGPGANTAALDQQRLLACLCRLSSMSLRHGSVGESVRAVHEFDTAIERCQESQQVSEFWNTLHLEMQAQLFYFIGTLLLKKAVLGDLRWEEARTLAGACYGVSVCVEPFTRRAAWYNRDGEEQRKTYDTWRSLAIRRYVITGHMMSELSTGASWISALQTQYLIPQVQQRLVKLVYTLPDMVSTTNQTYLSQSTLYTSVTLTLPSNITMTDMETELANGEVSDLSLLVWLAVQHRHQAAIHRLQYSYSHFARLVIDSSELKHSSLQTLSQLDIKAFVSAVVWDSVAELELNYVDRSQPLMLPPEIAPTLCTKEQSDWWTAAYKLVDTSGRVGEDWSRLQRTLQRGLDEIHLIGNHTMSLSLLVHLAQSFQDTEDAGSEYSKLSEARSVFYWQAVLDMIARVKKQKKMWIHKEWLFRPEPQLSLAERDAFMRQSKLSGMTYLAEVDLRHGRLEAALERFSKVDTAEASYQQAKIYTTMAAEALSGDDLGHLEQAREALCLTLDRLRGNQHNPLHHEVTELNDSLETRLNHSTLPRDPCERELSIRPGSGLAHSTPQSVHRTLYPAQTSSASRTALLDLSPVRAPVAASPDRIDAQLRALTLKHEEEMNKIRELVRSLQDKVEDLREEVAEVKELVKKVPQALPPDPGPAPGPAPAPSGPPIIPPAPHQMGFPYYGYPMRNYDMLAPHAYPPRYAYAMSLPPQALAPLHYGYGAINAMGVRPGQHPAAAGLVTPAPPAQHDVYEEEDDYREGVNTNDWHQPPSHAHHSPFQASAMFSPQADAGTGPSVLSPGYFSNSPDSSLAGLPVISAVQAGGAVRPSLVAGTGVPGSIATTSTATVSLTTISSASKPSASVVVTSVPDPTASMTPPDVVTASTPATHLLRSIAAQGTDVKVTQTSSVKPPVVEDKKVAPVTTQASPNSFSNFTFGAPNPAPVAPVTTHASPGKPNSFSNFTFGAPKLAPVAPVTILASPDKPNSSNFTFGAPKLAPVAPVTTQASPDKPNSSNFTFGAPKLAPVTPVTTQASPGKPNSFSNFTFGAPNPAPVTPVTTQASPGKPNSFSNFTYGAPNPAPAAPVTTQASPGKPNPSNFTFGAPNPATVAAVTPASSVRTPVNHFTSPVKTPSAQYIAPAKSPATRPESATTSPAGTVTSPGGGDGEDGQFVPNIDFKPIVDLVTGEENKGTPPPGFRQPEEKSSYETYAIRFMTEEDASLFKNAVDAAKLTERKPAVESDNRASLLAKLLTSAGEESDSDVDFVGEELPSPGKVNVARSYRLPDTFYNYEKHTDCPGCLGCIEPPFDFSKIGQAGVYVGMVAQQGRPKVDKREPETSKASSPPASCMFGAAGGLVDLASLASASTNDMPSTKKTDESDSDVDFVGEELPSPGKVKVARSYRLPDTFYNYEKHTECPGCLGCIEPSFDFSKIGQAGVYAGVVAQQGHPKVDKREPETSKASSPPASCMFGAAGGLVDLASLASGSTNDMPSTKKTDELDSDIDFEGEELPSPGKVKAARSYRLPDTFYNYEKHTDCPGCLGCIEPPFDFSKIGQAGVYVGMVAQQGKAAANIADTKMITNEVDSSAASASVPPSVPAAAVSSVESSTPVSVPACQPTTAPFSFTRPSTLRGLQQKDDSLCLQY